MCIVLQQDKFHFHYTKLQYEKLSRINSLVVSEENKKSGYKLNFFL